MTAAEIEITGKLQREAWSAKDLPPVEQVRGDLWSIPVPIPHGPLRYVSVYVLVGDSSLTLIDAGWDYDDAWAALNAGLASAGASVTDVSGCLVTHQHADHLGLARRIREASGAWISLHQADLDIVSSPSFRDADLAYEVDAAWLRRLGATVDDLVVLSERFKGISDPRGRMAIPDRVIADGERVELPGWTLRAIHTPGHTPGHLCFVDDDRKLVFAGDHVLPRISPNISADRRPGMDALGNFLSSLDKIAAAGNGEVLPAHEWRFLGLADRAAQLKKHHDARLTELLGALERNPDSTPWLLAGQLTWSRSWDQYDGFMRIAAVEETAAHLAHLLVRGDIAATDSEVPRYSLAR